MTTPDISRVTACIVNKDSDDYLVAAVQCFLTEDVGEIIVVDNCSASFPNSPILGDPRIIIIKLDRNVGYGSACNIATERARRDAQHFVISNPDLTFTQGTIKTLLESLCSMPHKAFIGPELINRDGSRYENGRRFPKGSFMWLHILLRKWHNNPGSKRYYMADHDRTLRWYPEWISGAFFVVDRLHWNHVGGFDSRFFMFMEDVDLCWRLNASGCVPVLEPQARVVHVGGGSTSKHRYRMAISHTRSTWLWWRRRKRPILLPLYALALPPLAVVKIVQALIQQAMTAIK